MNVHRSSLFFILVLVGFPQCLFEVVIYFESTDSKSFFFMCVCPLCALTG